MGQLLKLATNEVRKRKEFTWWGQNHEEEVKAEAKRQGIALTEMTVSQGGKHASTDIDRIRKELWLALSGEERQMWKDPGVAISQADV